MHLIRHHQMPGCTQIQEKLVSLSILAVQLVNTICHIDAHVIVFGNIGSHADTKAALKGMLAADQYDLDIVPDTLVIVIRRAIMQVHIVQPLQGMEIAAAQENDSSLFRRTSFLALVFRKKE